MQAGWRIIPLHRVGPDGTTCSCREGAGCKNAGKHPKNLDWSKAESMSAPDVYETWGGDTPPNIGTVTGEPSGIWVLDLDPDAGGIASFTKLVGAHEKLPKTLRHKTGSGGYHLIFSLPAGFRPKSMSNALGDEYPGIDVRGVGGQIVLPPSRSGKGPYSVAYEGAPLPAPEWLTDLIPQIEDVTPVELDEEDLAEYDALSGVDRGVVDRYIDAAVRGVVRDLLALPRPWHEGAGWDQGVHRAACRLYELAQQSWSSLTYRDAYEVLELNAPTDDQWGARQLDAKWQAAMSTVGKKPMPRPRGSVDADMDAWGFDEGDDRPKVLAEFEDRPAPERGDPEPPSPRRTRRVRFKFDGTDAFSEPDDKGKRQFQAYDTALAIKAVAPVANGDDGALWAHNSGIWTPQPRLIQDSLALTLKNAYQTNMVGPVTHHVEARSPQMVVGPTPNVINFSNGMLRWKSLELIDHDPKQFSTIQLPHAWNPGAECPMFDQFLAESLPEAGIKLAWEIIAVALYSGNPIQRAILLYGPPGSGKSVLLDVISNLLGQENVSRVTLQGLSGRFNAAELYGRAANICADIDATKITETGAFKMLATNDSIQGERKNRDPFSFKSFATLFFSANTIPGSDDRSGAWTRRFAILHFPHPRPVDARVLDFSSVLLQEAEGIIAKALSILPGVLQVGEYSLIRADQVDFEKKTNYLLAFIDDELEPADMTDETAFVPTPEIQWRYKIWCDEEGYEHPASWKKVAETLTQQGYRSDQKRWGGPKVRGWRGFRLKPRAGLPQEANPFHHS